MDSLHPSKRGKKELCKCVEGLKCSYCKWVVLQERTEEEFKDYQIDFMKEEIKRLKKEVVKLKSKTEKYCNKCGKVKIITPAEVRTGLCRECRPLSRRQ